MSDHHETPTSEPLEHSYARLGEENLELIAERDQLRDQLSRYNAAIEETDQERHRRWGQQILDGLDASGPRSVVCEHLRPHR
jgi:hypothetical protein